MVCCQRLTPRRRRREPVRRRPTRTVASVRCPALGLVCVRARAAALPPFSPSRFGLLTMRGMAGGGGSLAGHPADTFLLNTASGAPTPAPTVPECTYHDTAAERGTIKTAIETYAQPDVRCYRLDPREQTVPCTWYPFLDGCVHRGWGGAMGCLDLWRKPAHCAATLDCD